MRYIKILYLVSLIFLLYSCGTIKEGFTNQKKTSSDEFLVEKKSPLVMPPNFNELPVPKTEASSKTSDDNKIKEMLKNDDAVDDNSQNINSSFEESLLEKIKKN